MIGESIMFIDGIRKDALNASFLVVAFIIVALLLRDIAYIPL